MPDQVIVVLAAAGGALLGALGPLALRRLPEPLDDETGEPDPDKITYATLAGTPRLSWWLALGAAMYGAIAAVFLDEKAFVPAWVVLGAFGVLLAFIDAKTHLLPRYLVWPLYVLMWLGVALAALLRSDTQILLHALYGNLIVFAAFVLLYVVAALFFRGGFGYGDVRLSAALGVLLGPLGMVATFAGIYAGFALGAVIGLARNRGCMRGQAALAFGPFMILGALAALYF